MIDTGKAVYACVCVCGRCCRAGVRGDHPSSIDRTITELLWRQCPTVRRWQHGGASIGTCLRLWATIRDIYHPLFRPRRPVPVGWEWSWRRLRGRVPGGRRWIRRSRDRVSGCDWTAKRHAKRPSVFHAVSRLLPNTHRQRRRDSTVELSRVGGVYWIRNWFTADMVEKFKTEHVENLIQSSWLHNGISKNWVTTADGWVHTAWPPTRQLRRVIWLFDVYRIDITRRISTTKLLHTYMSIASAHSKGSRTLRPQDTSIPSLSRITDGVVSRRNCPRSEVSQSCSG